jgi:hypothetical protein
MLCTLNAIGIFSAHVNTNCWPEFYPTNFFCHWVDLVNMFNNMSRRQCRNILRRDFPDLLSVFDNLYKQATKVWIALPDGTSQALLMIEGFNQGCPLSSILAALILQDILHAVKLEHDARRIGNGKSPGQER